MSDVVTRADSVEWESVLKNTINFGSYYQIVPTEGYLAWEYNPLRNYRLSKNMYEKDGKYYTETEAPEDAILREAGELVDFITNELSFDLSHPVEILPQPSYDGSVNLIINDGLNIPRLINSRFTVTGSNTYKVVDRKGDNDTNIYDQGTQFDVDTSLFKNVNKIPKLEYLGTANGNMKIGNYHFYFKYSDADGNESDWVAESGLVSVFMGNTPQSVNTGIKDENSIKSVRFRLSNIDIGYSYVKVYYTRYSADVATNLVVQAKRIDKNFLVSNSGICTILITGDENETDVTLEEINSSFDVIQNAKTQCSVANRLFMANIHKSKIEYDILSKLSLCFCPYKHEEDYPLVNDGINEVYEITAKSDGYYDSQYIYDKTGYWPGELYRLGIVYILKDGSLSPVFNIRGATNIPVKSGEPYYVVENKFNSNSPLSDVLASIDYSEEDFMIIGGVAENENAKGVIQLSESFHTVSEPFPVLGINITANKAVIKEIKKYAKGFFFVRQKRMPLTLCQGIVVGLDNESRTPTLPTLAGVLTDLDYENTFIETSDINDINYISEGFLGHYKFKLDKKPLGFWKKVGIAAAVITVLAAAVVATIFTCGAAGVALGVGIATSVSVLGVTGVMGVAVATGLAAAAAIGASVIGFGIQTVALHARQKRNKRQAMALKGRNEPIPEGYERNEYKESRIITHDIEKRYVIKDNTKNIAGAIIVPDYQVNSPFYNQIFTGDNFAVKLTHEQPNTNYLTDGYFISEQRHFYIDGYVTQSDNRTYQVDLVGVPDGCPVKMIKEDKYCARAGYPEEAYKYEFQGVVYDDAVNQKANSDIIRGNFGSFVGMRNYKGHACDQVEIKIPGYSENKLQEYVQLRAQDTSAFFAISDRIDVNNLSETKLLQQAGNDAKDFSETYFRGDCYICQYTHRVIRNFNDPSSPYNDKIVDPDTWKDNYDPDKPEDYAKINLGDVNAVRMGLWLTFQLRSSYNLNIRTIDKSNIDEYLMCGNYRSHYPNYGQLALGSQKIPDSDQYNKGFSKSVSEKYYFEIPDVPYIKQEFQNRIVFSDIHINDAYKNGFRVLRTMNHKDYPTTYGSITKILELKNALLIVFEHGVGLVAINNNAEHPSQVLSDLNMITDTFGSQWKDSVIKTPGGVYGVDTVAKKIWRVKQGQIELISDLKVQEFLNQNITLSERELTPILGVRNVKTVYNEFKKDVMFTFYDNLYGTSEKSWNLCYNEMLGIFTTFYSWIPSDMCNIDNIPFSFNRDTVKAIGKLGVSKHGNDFSDGVTLSNNVIGNGIGTPFKFSYLDEKGLKQECDVTHTPKGNFVGYLYTDNRILLDNKTPYYVTYELLRDRQGNHNLFEIVEEEGSISTINTLFKKGVDSVKVSYLRLKDGVNISDLHSELYYRNSRGVSYADSENNKVAPGDSNYSINDPIFKNKAGKRLMLPRELQINPDKIVRYLNIKAKVFIDSNNEDLNATESYYNQFANGDHATSMIDAGYFESSVAVITSSNLQFLSTDFWKHGQAGLIDICDKIYPTYWYGQQHPFEFECVVVDDPSVHKIFTNLELVANKAKPESFHYEIVGDVYDFSEDKPTMYFRQEALKALYQYNGYDIEYNPNFLEIEPKQHNRSADLPKYYSRWDTVNDVYDSYKRFSAPMGFNYDHLAGAEIVYYPTRNEFRVWNHTEAIDVDSLSQDLATSVIKANCRYLEDKWLVSINPIIITYKNELGYDLIDGVKHFKRNDLYTPLSDPKEEAKYRSGLFAKDVYNIYKYSSWVKADEKGSFSGTLLPPINIQGTKMEENSKDPIQIPDPNTGKGKDNALYGLYDLSEWDKGNWSPIENPIKISNANKDRRETDVRGKFIKVRIRYSGEELAIIDFLNTIYQISFA